MATYALLHMHQLQLDQAAEKADCLFALGINTYVSIKSVHRSPHCQSARDFMDVISTALRKTP